MKKKKKMKTISQELGLNESNDESDNNGSNKFDDDECYVLKWFFSYYAFNNVCYVLVIHY